MQLSPASPIFARCDDIYSDNKSTRQRARSNILRYTQNLSQIDSYASVAPAWKKMAAQIKATLEGHFPFAINTRKAGVIFESYTDWLEQRVSPRTNFIDLPAYITVTAHGIPNRDNTDDLKEQINLLRTDGFCGLPEDVLEHALARTRNVVAVNYCRSFDPAENRVKEAYIRALQNLSDSNVFFVVFSWTPVLLNNVTFKHAKRFARLFEANSEVFKACKSQFMKGRVIPMQTIRDYALRHAIMAHHLKILTNGNAERPVCVATMDSDATALNEVFAGYDQMIAVNPELRIASTGYEMQSDVSEFVKKACEVDQLTRVALGRFAYPPEPNFIVRILPPNKKGLDKITYLRKGSTRGKSLESIGVIEGLGFNDINSRDQIVYNNKHSIVTAATRAKIPKHMPKVLSSNDYLDPKILKSFRKFMQTAYNPVSGFSPSVLRLMSGFGGQKNNGIISRLFMALDPIECAKAFPIQWPDLYKHIQHALTRLIKSKTKDLKGMRSHSCKYYASRMQRKLQLNDASKLAVEKYLTVKLNTYIKNHEILSRKGLTDYQLASILAKVTSVGIKVYNYFMRQHERALKKEKAILNAEIYAAEQLAFRGAEESEEDVCVPDVLLQNFYSQAEILPEVEREDSEEDVGVSNEPDLAPLPTDEERSFASDEWSEYLENLLKYDPSEDDTCDSSDSLLAPSSASSESDLSEDTDLTETSDDYDESTS